MALLTKRRHLALLAAFSLVAAGCGARLSSAQLAAAKAAWAGSSASAGNGSVNGGSGSGGLVGSRSATNSPGNTVAGNGSTGSGGGTGTGSTSNTTSGAGRTVSGAPSSSAAAPGSYFGVSAGAVSILPSVCKGPVSGPGISSSEIDVGDVTTVTGPIPGLEAGAIHGIDAFAAYINSLGGICGRRLVVKIADDNLDASQNATATESLAGKVMAFVGSDSGVDQGGATYLQSHPDIPYVAEALSPQAFDLSSNFSPMPVPLGLNLAPFLYFKRKDPAAITHMAVLAQNQPTALADTKAQVQAMESIGYKFVYTDYNIEPTQSDFSSDAQAMKSAGAQGVYFLSIGSFYADVARAIQNAGLSLKLPIYSENAYDPSFTADAGSAANGSTLYSALAMFQGQDSNAVPMVGLFNKWFRAISGGAIPDEFAAWGWMDGLMFIEGLNAGGGLTRPNLMNGLRQLTAFTGGGFESSINPGKKTPPQCYLLIDVVNQQYVRDPADPSTGLDCANTPDYYYAKS